jgi:hypothetical protein
MSEKISACARKINNWLYERKEYIIRANIGFGIIVFLSLLIYISGFIVLLINTASGIQNLGFTPGNPHIRESFAYTFSFSTLPLIIIGITGEVFITSYNYWQNKNIGFSRENVGFISFMGIIIFLIYYFYAVIINYGIPIEKNPGIRQNTLVDHVSVTLQATLVTNLISFFLTGITLYLIGGRYNEWKKKWGHVRKSPDITPIQSPRIVMQPL